MGQSYLNNLKKNEFVKSYNQIFDCEYLTLEEKNIISIILSYESNNLKCFLSYEMWSIKLSCSARTVKRTMKDLQDKGFIDWDSGYSVGQNKKANTYKTTQKMYDAIFCGEVFDDIEKIKYKDEPKSKEADATQHPSKQSFDLIEEEKDTIPFPWEEPKPKGTIVGRSNRKIHPEEFQDEPPIVKKKTIMCGDREIEEVEIPMWGNKKKDNQEFTVPF